VNRRRLGNGVVETTVLGGLALLLLAFGFKAGGSVLLAVALLVTVAAVAAIARVDLAHAGLIATCGFVFCSSWTGWYIAGHQRPRALFLILALILLLAAHLNGRFPRVPWWYLALVGSVMLDTVLNLLLPTSTLYLDNRYLEIPGGTFGAHLITGISDFGTGLRFLFTLIGAALAISICALHFPRAPLWIAIAYTAGASLSGLVAFSDHLGVTSVGHALTGIGFRGDRATGFADHPVLMAAGNVYAIAIAAWLITTNNVRNRMVGLALLPGLVLGTYASKSRGGEICLVLAILVCLVILPQYRRRLHLAALGAGLIGVALFAVFPKTGHALLVAMRLAGNSGPSDQGRIAVLKQGVRDFMHSPIDGIGLHVVDEAHNVIVQSLAAGGLILFLGFMCLQVGGAFAAIRLIRTQPLAAPLLATFITGFLFGNLENTLTEPLVYVPVALIVALGAQQALEPERDGTSSGDAVGGSARMPGTSTGGERTILPDPAA